MKGPSWQKWSIHKLANRVSYTRQLHAARTICDDGSGEKRKGHQEKKKNPSKNPRPAPEIIAALTAVGESAGVDRVDMGGNSLGLEGPLPVSVICNEKVRVGFGVSSGPALDGLNRSQQSAVAAAVSQRLTLIQA